jgi:hypothetical protein
LGCVCDDVANALQTFDQGARLRAIAPVAGRDREPDRQAQGTDSGVDLRCQAASGAANTGIYGSSHVELKDAARSNHGSVRRERLWKKPFSAACQDLQATARSG